MNMLKYTERKGKSLLLLIFNEYIDTGNTHLDLWWTWFCFQCRTLSIAYRETFHCPLKWNKMLRTCIFYVNGIRTYSSPNRINDFLLLYLVCAESEQTHAHKLTSHRDCDAHFVTNCRENSFQYRTQFSNCTYYIIGFSTNSKENR